MASSIEGQESQIVTVDVRPGEVLRAESGAMLYMTEGVTMETTTGGGASAGFKRMITGQNLFLSDFRYEGAAGTAGRVALGTDFPSKILRLNLQEYSGKLVCQKGALLCASHTVDVEMEFAKKLTAGFFGGEGFVLQALTGTGDVFVKAGGTVIKKDLREGQTLRVSSGALVAFEDGVDFDVTTMPGFKNVVFGGEGLFVTTLTGPGTVWMQGMPPDRMVNEIARRVPRGGGIGLGVPIGLGGGGGGSEATDGGEEEAEATGEDGGADEAVAAADAAVDADRHATVASSGVGADEDPDSASALFGDAAAPGASPSSGNADPTTTFEDDGSSSTGDGGFEEETTFSTEDDVFGDDFGSGEESAFGGNDDDGFGNDGFSDESTFDTEDSFSSSEDAMDTGGGDDESSGFGQILNTLWDMFRDDD